MMVHLPVPFWPAVSRILSTSGCPIRHIFIGEDVGGDFNQERVEIACVPVGEDLVHVVGGHPEAVFQR